uniref:Putative proline-rich protein n=1 Tax=Arabidopsis thaliana TaxID=3702 RepID=Q9ZW08_ARATH|nr:putative proline-rich protein [Arabidopsis thaliana]
MAIETNQITKKACQEDETEHVPINGNNGTSAEQDTRFSNKQAKLMKSQKFAPELENLVDITKVKMDVMKPWIATRVTELLGIEDEVLINFIYGLLDGKVVNGKEIQITLTGFMEKNTGKFMKELWTLLLSAQNNPSGVPQQFLDARAAETKKKQEEANEIMKKREGDKKNIEHDILRKIDSGVEHKETNGMDAKPSRDRPEDGRRADEKNGVKERRSIFRYATGTLHVHLVCWWSRNLFVAKIIIERKSRSTSQSSDASISPRKRRLSNSRRRSRSRSVRRSLSPRRRRIHSPFRSRSRSPIRRHRRPTHEGRRQSPAPSRRRRSPSPPARRRRSPSPPARRRRSPSPPARRHRSPTPPARQRRSPSPPARRHRSPPPARRRRSPSPPARRRRSPSPPARRRRSPSPLYRRNRSPSPLYRRNRSRSPLAKRGRSDSPGRSPSPVARLRDPTGARLPSPSIEQRLPSPPVAQRLPSPPPRRAGLPSPPPAQRLPSPPPRRAGLPSPMRIGGSHAANHLESPSPSSLSPPGRKKVLPSPPVRRRRSLTPDEERVSLSQGGRHTSPSHIKQDGSMSPVRGRGKSSPSSRHQKARSPVRRRSPTPVNRRSRRSSSASRSPDRRRRRSPSSSRSPSRSRSPPVLHRSPSPRGRKHQRERRSPGRLSEEQDRVQNSKLLKRTSVPDTDKRKQLPEKLLEVGRVEHYKEQERKSDKLSEKRSVHRHHGSQMSPVENSEGRSRPVSSKVKDSEQVEKEDNSDLDANLSCDSKDTIRHQIKDKNRRKNKRSSREEVSSDDNGSSDSDVDDRKEAKRRRKEEKKTRKEEKKRRREERHRKREERRGGKEKHKKQELSDTSEGEVEARPKIKKGEESDPKRLEIELRNKALESLKAKKGISH